jgi:hypothetical protein
VDGVGVGVGVSGVHRPAASRALAIEPRDGPDLPPVPADGSAFVGAGDRCAVGSSESFPLMDADRNVLKAT